VTKKAVTKIPVTENRVTKKPRGRPRKEHLLTGRSGRAAGAPTGREVACLEVAGGGGGQGPARPAA